MELINLKVRQPDKHDKDDINSKNVFFDFQAAVDVDRTEFFSPCVYILSPNDILHVEIYSPEI